MMVSMNDHIVVGYNATPSSTEAVLWAADEAAMRKSTLRVVSCYEIPVAGAMAGPWLTASVYDTIMDCTNEQAEAIKASLATSHPELAIDVVVSAGPASSSLLDELEHADLLVVGSSGHQRTASFWLGSTARSVARHSPCPVAVVRGAASRGRPDRIVVGVDGSVPSGEALMWAADEADLYGVGLTVVHSWHYPYIGLDTEGSQARDLTQIDAACVLEESVEAARERCGVDVTGLLVDDSPASAVLGAVRDGDLLVLGSRGHGALTSGLIGSTVNSVMDLVAVPLIIVR